ncbi:MAG: recombinase family protein [Firmicutes bacterium]|nr:recombinase family protein [Bacillota bacterium]
MKKCYIYTRVSTAAQTEGYSLDAQEESLKAYAEYRELQIAGSYCDAGKSGKNIKGRPAFRQMMTDIKSQKDDISFVLVFKLSRFGRNAADILKSLQLLEDFGIDLVSVEEAIDSSTQGGRLTLAILSAVAEMERENITVQFMAGKMQKVLEGGWTGGAIPYGYKNVDHELVLVPSEAEVIRKIYELYQQEDMSASAVAYELNQSNLVRVSSDRKQKPFTYEFVSRVLDNPFYCGRVYYNRRTNKKDRDGKTIQLDEANIITAEGKHEIIVSPEVWDSVHAKRVEIAKRYKKTDDSGHVHLLSGIVKCPLCGKGLTGMISRTKNLKGDGYYKPIYYYKCRYNTRQNGKTCLFDQSLNQEIIDGLVLKILQRLQTYKEFEETLQSAFGDQGNVEKTEKRLQDLRKELRETELTKDRLGEKLDGLNPLGKDYDKKYEEISDKLDSMYDRIEVLESDIVYTKKKLDALKLKAESTVQIMTFMENLPLIYAEMSDEERKEMFQAFVDEIELFLEARADGKMIRSISFKFPMVFDGKPLVKDSKPEDTISFKLDCADIDIDLPDKGNIIMKKQADGSQKVIVRKGTYANIKAYILENYNVKVPTLYIAQIKRKYGLEIGKAYNKPEKNKNHVPKCTKEKELLIMEALKFYDLMEQDVEYREDAV